MEEKIQKINPLYLLGYILGPAAIAAASIGLGALCFPKGGNGAVITFMVIPILVVIWWIFGGSFIFKKKTKELEQKFTDQGYKRNHTFYGRGKTVVLDIEKGIIGIAFFWNPSKLYILPASRIGKAWVDDGKMGTGFMEGSSRVSFLFTIDDIKVRVDTFTSNQRFRMDDKHILTGISKADMMVQSLEEAKANSSKSNSKPMKSTPKATKAESKSGSKSTKSGTKSTTSTKKAS